MGTKADTQRPCPQPANSSPCCCHNRTMLLLLFWLTPDVSYASLCTTCWLCVSVCVCVSERPLPLLSTSANTLKIFHSDWLLFFPAQAACRSPPTPRAWRAVGVGVGGWKPPWPQLWDFFPPLFLSSSSPTSAAPLWKTKTKRLFCQSQMSPWWSFREENPMRPVWTKIGSAASQITLSLSLFL